MLGSCIAALFVLSASAYAAAFSTTLGPDTCTKAVGDIQDQGVNFISVNKNGTQESCTFSNLASTGYTPSSVIVYYYMSYNATPAGGGVNMDAGTAFGGTPAVWTNLALSLNVDITPPFTERSWDISDIVDTETELDNLEIRVTNNDTSEAVNWDHIKVVVEYDYPPNYGPGGMVAPRGPHPGGGNWATGDTYQLMFVTSLRTNLGSGEESINYFNDLVNSVADGATNTGVSNITWYVLGSTLDVDASNNCVISYPVYLMDGASMFSSNNADFWDANVPVTINLNENAVQEAEVSYGRVWTGTVRPGVADANDELNSVNTTAALSRWNGGASSANWLDNDAFGNKTDDSYPFFAVSQPILITDGSGDTTAPSPDPMTFALAPTALTTNTIEMIATPAYDTENPPVEYLFTNTVLGDTSGWQLSPNWTNTVPPYNTNTYMVKARDGAGNETAWSSPQTATPVLQGPNGVVAPTGSHPTGGIWQAGMSYHLFFTSSSEHTLVDGMHPIEHWNDLVNTIADGSSLPGVPQLTWYVLGSTRAVDARDNAVVAAPVYLMDGTTLFATNNADFWDATIPVRSDGVTCNIDEDNNVIPSESTPYYGRVWTGTIRPGVKSSGNELDSVDDDTHTSRWNGGAGNANWLDNDANHLETIARRFFALSQEIIIGTNGMVDADPPSPDPMSFSIDPIGISTNKVHMRATPASDLLSAPVEYLFTNETTGANSGWQEGQYWTNTVSLFSSNSYMVKARDAVSNETGWSSSYVAYPLLTGPGGVVAPAGTNPVTGVMWAPGDIYQLIFLTRDRFDLGGGQERIAYFNDIVNSVADDSIVTGVSNLTWYVFGSTTEVDAKDNAVVGYPVYMLDGTSMIASNYDDFWDTVLPMTIDLDEHGVYVVEGAWQDRYVWTGTASGGVADSGDELDAEDTTTVARRFGLTLSWLDNSQNQDETDSNRFWAVSQPMRIPTNNLVDTTPPTPSPMTWNVEPQPDTFDSVTMRASSAYDLDSPPVEYLFSNSVTAETSGWQLGPDYTPTVSRGALNTFYVKARDSEGNETDWSAGVDCTPLLQGNNGIMAPSGAHPTNGSVWQIGDQYHLIFVTSGEENLNNGAQPISYFDGRVQSYANSSTNTGFPDATWRCLGSTTATNANDHLNIQAPVYRTDMAMVASNSTDFWDADLPVGIDYDEDSVHRFAADYTGSYGNTWTGTLRPGTADAANELDCGGNTKCARWGSAGWNNWLNNGETVTYTSLRPFFGVSEVLTIQIPPDPSSITNLTATSVTDTSVTFNAQLRTPLTNQLVYVHWGTTDKTNSFAWDSSAYVGTWDSVMLTNINFSTNGLTSDTTYYYTFRCTNDSTNFWATPSASFHSLTGIGALTVTNSGGATGIGQGSATLMGQILEGGQADVWICWGEDDGGTGAPSSWQNAVHMGTLTEGVAFSNEISGLYYGREYDYRVFASNAIDTAWSQLDSFFTTEPNTVKFSPSDINAVCSGHYKGHDNAIDGSGMTGDTHGNNNDDMWMTDGGAATSQWIKVDLGTAYTIEYLKIWNYNEANYANYDRGISQADVFVATTDPGNNTEGVENFNTNGWTMVLTNQALTIADGSATLAATDPQIDMGGVSARYIALRVDADHGDGNYLGLSELQVFYDETPSYSIENTSATNIVADSADVRGVLDCQGSTFDVYAYYSTVSNASGAAWLADGSAESVLVGSYTNSTWQNLSVTMTNLAGSTYYYYTLLATNDAIGVWASPNAGFATLGLPLVDNDGGGTGETLTSATIRGELTHGGFANAWICWGLNDAGASSTGDWANVVPMGQVTQTIVFSTLVTGLATNESYLYRCYVTNSQGEAWSASAESFAGKPVGTTRYAMQITFTNFAGMGTLTNFPALVVLTTNRTDNYTGFLDTDDGYDLRFYTNSLLSGDQLDCEIEHFDGASNSFVWVEIPVFTNNVSIWASWGDEARQLDYMTNGATWNNTFKGVWHMGENDGMAGDSTANGHDAAAVQGVPSRISDGQIGPANDFVHSEDDTIVIPQSSDFAVGANFTVSAWIYSRSDTGHEGIAGTHNGPGWFLELNGTSPANYLQFYDGGWRGGAGANDIAEGVWSYVVYTYAENDPSDAEDGRFHINGSFASAADANTRVADADLHIGAGGPGWNFPFDGYIDEVRISAATRSTNWIWACWMNQGGNHDSFVRYDPPERRDVILNTEASDVSDTQARLNAQLRTPDTNYTVYVHFGTADGGTSLGGWPEYFTVGSWDSVALTNISYLKTDLTQDTIYWYTFRASNDAGNVWAQPSWRLHTSRPAVATEGNLFILF